MLEIAQYKLLAPELGNVLRVLDVASSELSETEIRCKLSYSHNLAWRSLRKLTLLGWVTKKDGRYSISAKAMQVNPYNPISSVLLGRHGLRLLVAVKDFGPLSEKEASALIGVPRATVQRLVTKQVAAGILAKSEQGKVNLSTELSAYRDPFDLWPSTQEHDSLTRFVAHLANLMRPIAIILYGAPELRVAILYDAATPQVGETLRRIAVNAVGNEKLSVKALVIASRHAWLRELHRVHIPPSIHLRNALFGVAVFGEKPKHDFAYLYEAYNALSPISEDDKRAWLRKGWIVETDSGVEFTPVGLALNRKGPAKATVQDSEVMLGIHTVHIFT